MVVLVVVLVVELVVSPSTRMSLSVFADKTMNISSHVVVRIDQCSILTKGTNHDRGCSGCSVTKQSLLEVLPFVFINCKGKIMESELFKYIFVT